jgi:hypothetical protein
VASDRLAVDIIIQRAYIFARSPRVPVVECFDRLTKRMPLKIAVLNASERAFDDPAASD